MELSNNQIDNIRRVLAGDVKELMIAFTWSNTPQGANHWDRIYCGVEALTEADREYLTALIGDNAEINGYHAGRKFAFRLVTFDHEAGTHEFQPASMSYDIVRYVSGETGSRALPSHTFKTSDNWRTLLRLYGHYSYMTRYTGATTLVEIMEDGTEVVFGEVEPNLKAFGVKTTLDNLRLMCKWQRDMAYECQYSMENFIYDVDGVDHKAALTAALFYRPKFHEDQVEVFMNERDYNRGRTTKIRFGRFLRMMYPTATDAQIEKLHNSYRERFVKREFTAHRGCEAKDFRHAYTHDVVRSLNPRTSSERKSIHNSCMQDMTVGHRSPAETYASGDFEIIWLEDKEGEIAGRVVVYVGHKEKPQAGPIYGACEHSIDILEEEVEAMGAVPYEDATWRGARLQKIDYYGDYLVCYCDLEDSAYDDGDYFVIGRGDIELHTTQGYVTYSSNYCESCEDRVDVDETRHNEWGNCYCESCYNDMYTRCTINGCEISTDDAMEVLTSNSSHHSGASIQSPRWIIVGADVDCEECPHEGDYWLTEEMVGDVDGNFVSPRYAANNMLLIDGEYYDEAQLKAYGFTPEGVKIDAEEEEEKEEAA